ncbi:YhcN/YlaJ family sporulation lipoprotein [Paenibacillus herberti]|uniref:Sporulation protein n=1 Tax=Paenibacillus herberti TaxID=1619309 RepID=A0A229P4Q3_9BACL|nr:YhcN/YlaJ family sporulation lipoprotein [Paenibacillus herberti]OXM17088.1 hypothetical protein CGZ75_10810 [Paenibacillus herberti]
MKHPWKVLAAGLVLSTALAGCGTHQGGLGNKNIRNNDMGNYRLLEKRFANDGMNEMNRVKGSQMNGNNIIGNHKNYRLQSNRQIANDIKKIPGVRDAYVMTTNGNAYVAIGLKGESIVGNTRSGNEMGYSSSNTGRMGAMNISPRSGMGTNNMNMRMNNGISRLETDVEHGMNRLGNDMNKGMKAVERGMNNMIGNRPVERLGNDVNRGMNSVERGMGNMIDNFGRTVERPGNNGYSSTSNGYNAYGSNSNATNNRGQRLNGLADNNNIYMDRTLTDDYKKQVADAVRKNMPSIDMVFVSANPDYFSRMKGYDNDDMQGKAVQGYLAEFNAMVERVFPNVDDGNIGVQKKLSGQDVQIFK